MALDKSWSTWKIDFLENFDTKSWSEIVYAYNFKYIAGPLSDYALKKMKLLLTVEPCLPTIALINLVAVGLSTNLRERLNRAEISTQGDLMSSLGNLEHLVTKISEKMDKQGKQGENKKIFNKKSYKPCSICGKLGQQDRFHPEAKCWNNPDNSDNKLSLQMIHLK